MIILRDYQESARQSAHEQWKTHCSTLIVVPTGGGKTSLFAFIIADFQPRRALVLAHRRELIEQAVAEIKHAVGLECAVEMGEHFSDEGMFEPKPVVVGTIQTVSKRLHKFDPGDFGLLVIDEMHHGTAETYRRTLEHFRQNPKLKILGVTATPERADQEALSQVCESAAFNYGIAEAVRDGWLVDITAQFCQVNRLDLSEVKTTAGDLNQGELARIMEQDEVIMGCAQPIVEVTYGLPPKTLDTIALKEWKDYLLQLPQAPRRGIVFTVSVAQAEGLAGILNIARPSLAEWVCGKTDADDRSRILGRFQSGDTAICVNCAVLTEGYNNPAVEVIFMARPTKSRSLFQQMIGRSTRPLRGIVDGLATPEERRKAISASPKAFCISEGTPILTNEGLVPIERITTSMLLWDGVDFVPNGGIIFRGKQPVIEYAGLIATEHHNVWTKEGWQTFGKCAAKQTPIAVTAFGRSSIREADGYYRGSGAERTPKERGILAHGMHVRSQIAQGVLIPNIRTRGLSGVRTSEEVPALAVGAMRGSTRPMHESQLQSVSKIRRKGNRVSFYRGQRNGSMGSGTLGIAQGNDARPDRQRRTLRSWQSAVGNSHNSDEQPTRTTDHPGSARLQDCSSNVPNIPSLSVPIAETRMDMEAHRGNGKRQRPLQRTVKVFDILNSGPRNRFTAAGLLVSNCRVVDFVGNSGRHKLITPFDVLGGNISEGVIDRAKVDALKDGKPVRVVANLINTENKIKQEVKLAEQKRALVKADHSMQSVDVFGRDGLGSHWQTNHHAVAPASEPQRRCLGRAGVHPDWWTKNQAGRIIGRLIKNHWHLPADMEYLKRPRHKKAA